MPEKGGKSLVLEHQAAVGCAGSHTDNRSLRAFQNQILGRLLRMYVHHISSSANRRIIYHIRTINTIHRARTAAAEMVSLILSEFCCYSFSVYCCKGSEIFIQRTKTKQILRYSSTPSTRGLVLFVVVGTLKPR